MVELARVVHSCAFLILLNQDNCWRSTSLLPLIFPCRVSFFAPFWMCPRKLLRFLINSKSSLSTLALSTYGMPIVLGNDYISKVSSSLIDAFSIIQFAIPKVRWTISNTWPFCTLFWNLVFGYKKASEFCKTLSCNL